MMLALFKMIGMNLFVYVAVLPIIIFTGQRAGSFMAGLCLIIIKFSCYVFLKVININKKSMVTSYP